MEYLFTQTPLSFFVQDLWRDEAFSFFMASQHIGEILKTTAIDFSPPLYYILLHYWMQLFGTTEVVMRSLSLGFHLLTCYVLIEILIHVFHFSFRRALIYFPLFLTAPFLLYYGFEARMYAMVAFFVTLSYFALWKKQFALYIFAISCAMYTQYLAIVIFLLQAMTTLGSHVWTERKTMIKFCTKKPRLSELLKTLVSVLIKPSTPFLVSTLCYVPWVVFMISSRSTSGEDFWVLQPPIKDILYLPFVLFTGYERVFGEYYHDKAGYVWDHTRLLLIVSTVLVFPIAYKCIRIVRAYLHANSTTMLRALVILCNFCTTIVTSKWIPVYVWAFALPLLLFFLSFVMTPLYHPRYFIMAAPGFILLLILSLDYIARTSESWINQHIAPRVFQNKQVKIFSFILPLVFVIALFQSLSDFQTLNLTYRSKRTISTLYREIAMLRHPGEPVLLTNELDYHLALYYIGQNDIYILHKSFAEIPSYVGKVLIPRSAFTNAPPRFPKRSYIVHYDSYDIYSEF